MVHPDAIKLLAALYMKHTGENLSGLGVRCGAGQKFFFNLRSGKTYTAPTGLKVYRWFHANWPADLPWPWRGQPPLLGEADVVQALQHHTEGSCPSPAS